jgi:hypothetical protein
VKVFLSIFALIFFVTGLSGQTDSVQKNDTASGRLYLIQEVNRNGVVMPEIEIKPVTVVARPTTGSSKRDFRKYDRLVYNIKKVYPYALIVRQKMDEVNAHLQHLDSDRKRREYLKEFEKSIFKEYQDDISKMTISQGRLLIKLIDRETQNTSFELIREYRGKFSAAFWQGIAKIFGTNLKEEYDRFGDDALIEIIIYEIESGNL